MDLLKRGCSGASLCRFTKIVQRVCFNVLAYKNLLPYSLKDVCGCRGIGSTRFLLRNQSHLVQYGRMYSTTVDTNPIGHKKSLKAFELVQADLAKMSGSICTALHSDSEQLHSIAQHYFQSGGKLLRPLVVLLMGKLCAHNLETPANNVAESQYKVAFISEMIHAASLVHDDVIDESDMRRNRPTVNRLWGNKKAVLVGDFILAKATQVLASIGNPEVVMLLAQVIEDLVRGEFMQAGTREGETDRLTHYIEKSYKKTASLFAHSCKAVSVLSSHPKLLQEAAYQYGKCIGVAFQLIDDTLDFESEEETMGKPTGADLKLGLATAPVLFAVRQFPELETLILRRFSNNSDATKAFDLVLKSDGLLQTRQLAHQYSRQAIRELDKLPQCQFRDALVEIADHVVSRER